MLTRRRFHRMLTTTGALAGFSPGVLSAAIDEKRPGAPSSRMRLGIGLYTYHGLSIDAMIEQLRMLDITEVEMSRGEFMLFSKPRAEMFKSVRARFDKACIRCVSYYTATIKTDADLENAV